MVALGEPRLAFRVTTLQSERQQSAVDAAFELLPPSSVCIRLLTAKCCTDDVCYAWNAHAISFWVLQSQHQVKAPLLLVSLICHPQLLTVVVLMTALGQQ